MIYNKEEKVYSYYDLGEILKLNIPNSVRTTMEQYFNRNIFYESNDKCKVGKLIGIESNYQFSNYYYIIEDGNSKIHIPIHQSITAI